MARRHLEVRFPCTGKSPTLKHSKRLFLQNYKISQYVLPSREGTHTPSSEGGICPPAMPHRDPLFLYIVSFWPNLQFFVNGRTKAKAGIVASIDTLIIFFFQNLKIIIYITPLWGKAHIPPREYVCAFPAWLRIWVPARKLVL